ncbi:MAG: sulfotransferase domain-containing protein [Promethearchaeota archaeon]
MGEDTPNYLFYPPAARRAFHIIPNAKLIILLRNPVFRAYSHYWMNFRGGYEKLNFKEAIQKCFKLYDKEKEKMLEYAKYDRIYFPKYSYLARGLYYKQIMNWLKYFPKKQMFIIKSEDMMKNPSEIFCSVQDFLNIPRIKLKIYKKYNKREYPKMDEKLKETLIEFFKPHNQKLYNLLGRDFKWEQN